MNTIAQNRATPAIAAGSMLSSAASKVQAAKRGSISAAASVDSKIAWFRITLRR